VTWPGNSGEHWSNLAPSGGQHQVYNVQLYSCLQLVDWRLALEQYPLQSPIKIKTYEPALVCTIIDHDHDGNHGSCPVSSLA
jgi:hypothetical protein